MRRALVILLAAGSAACGSSGPRPLRPAAEEVVDASARLAWTAALQAVTDQGLPLRLSDLETRIIETDLVDIAEYRPEARQYPYAERLVRFRILVAVDPEGEGARVLFFGLYSPFQTGLSNTRRNEREIPRDHPAMRLIRDMAAKVRKTIEGG